jgi:hypothetical protein
LCGQPSRAVPGQDYDEIRISGDRPVHRGFDLLRLCADHSEVPPEVRNESAEFVRRTLLDASSRHVDHGLHALDTG